MSDETICYFIGGPMDLTKSAVRHTEPYLFALEVPALTLSQINSKTEAKHAMEILESRHRYRRCGPLPIQGVAKQVLIYAYIGLEYKDWR